MPDDTEPPAAAHDAAARGDLDGLRAALTADRAAVNDTNEDGWTPLHLAAYYGHAGCVLVLLAHGADPRVKSTNATANTALHAAIAGAESPLVVLALLEGGANPHATGTQDYTPLHVAAARGNRALADLLLQHGADPRARLEDGSMPHHLATDRGHATLGMYLEGHAAP